MNAPALTVKPLRPATWGDFETAMRAAMTGIASAFTAARFTAVARPGRDRPVMAYQLP
ncbi:hypothetical protein [Polymorphospora rubra]|uniref:GNAT family N-acetyltransferase n=1 Tax=Polymorphospora rubra TaxID=338584 RepID=A0A810N3N7_9ACTN|nr:hypothetical protein [Polymorphospora rubra]BCJ68082.1 hypothetical protein Prubr_51030 [Polymorphospora rubra]